MMKGKSISRRTILKSSGKFLMLAPLIDYLSGKRPGKQKFDPSFGTATQAIEALRTRAISAQELVAHVFDRIHKYNPKVNAFITLIEDEARTRAKEADEALAAGSLWGALHGLPVVIKDQFSTAGVRTTYGSKSKEQNIPERDALPVSRLKQAGAIIIGKTSLPPFAGGYETSNEIIGRTNNPWDLKRTPGGSTGGGAAALAAGLGFLELGSDLAGSIRNPSHFCGVYGHKTTIRTPDGKYLIPSENPEPPSPGAQAAPNVLAVAGPLARNAQDLWLELSIVGGQGAAKLPPPRRSRLRDYRLGYILDDPFCTLVPEVADILSNTIDALGKRRVKLIKGWPAKMDFQIAFENYYFLLSSFTSNRGLKQSQTSVESALDYFIKRRHQALNSTSEERAQQYALQDKIRNMWSEYFKEHDAFLMPVNFVPAFYHHDPRLPPYEMTIQTSKGARPYLDILKWVSLASLTGCPATVVPVGRTREGLPVGMQIMGPYFEDRTTIKIAELISNVLGGFVAPPGYAG